MCDQPKDTIYRDPNAAATPFRFDATVARVFDDMIGRSVPGYDEVQAVTAALLVERAANATEPFRVLDLGCSTGRSLRDTATLRHAQGVTTPFQWIAVDLSPDMLEQARSAWDTLPAPLQDGFTVEWVQADITQLSPQPVDAVLLQYTLQFLPPNKRPKLLAQWAESLRPNGLMLLSEKIRFDDDQQQDASTEAHLDFKRSHGYSDLEIAGKRQALENVLRAEAIDTNEHWLAQAGLVNVRQLGLWDVFASFAGDKSSS